MRYNEKIQKLRKERHLSQEEFGEQIGVSRQAVHKWESGYSCPDADKLLAISRAFHVSVDYLLKDELQEEQGFQAQRKSRWTASGRRRLLAWLLVGFDCLVYSVLWILAKAFPEAAWYLELDFNGDFVREFHGVKGLIYNRQLEGLMGLMIVAAIAAAVLFLYEYKKGRADSAFGKAGTGTGNEERKIFSETVFSDTQAYSFVQQPGKIDEDGMDENKSSKKVNKLRQKDCDDSTEKF